MSINVQHLTSTGIGRTVNALRKDDGEIGSAAKALISKWKQMVASQESDGDEGNGNGNGNDDGDEEEPQIDYGYECENDDANKVQTESIGNCERKSHKTHEYPSKGSTSNNNHHHHRHQHHHRDQNHHHAHGKMSDNHSMDEKVMCNKKD